MHQFSIQPMFGTDSWQMAGHNISFTNSALWAGLSALVLLVFVLGGLKRQMIPGRWQMAVEYMTGFIDNMLAANVGPAGKKYVPYVFSLFMFILVANILGLLPLGIVGIHPFTVTSHISANAVLAILSFGTVLVVGLWRHGFHFFSLFVPHGTPWWLLWLIPFIEVISFLVRPFSLALRLFVAMMAGHLLLEVLSSFVISGFGSATGIGGVVGILSFILMVGICALEILVAGIQAYVFALLTSLYINDAENLH